MKRIMFLTCVGSLTLALTAWGAPNKTATKSAKRTVSAHAVSPRGGGHSMSHAAPMRASRGVSAPRMHTNRAVSNTARAHSRSNVAVARERNINRSNRANTVRVDRANAMRIDRANTARNNMPRTSDNTPTQSDLCNVLLSLLANSLEEDNCNGGREVQATRPLHWDGKKLPSEFSVSKASGSPFVSRPKTRKSPGWKLYIVVGMRPNLVVRKK